MLLNWVVASGLLEHDSQSNVLLAFPPPIRRVLISEVTNYLHASIASGSPGAPSNASSTATTPTVLASSLSSSAVGGAYALSSAPSTPARPSVEALQSTAGGALVVPLGFDGLGTMFHVSWVMEVIGQAFSLPLEDMPIITNAAAIYMLWLADPRRRPLVVQESDAPTQQAFIQTLYRHISLLFQPKRMDGIGAVKPLLASYASKHVELCRVALRTIVAMAIDERETFSPETWNVILSVMLGTTDSLLRIHPNTYIYLVEEIGEQLLSAFTDIWLRSQVFSPHLWSHLQAAYPVWTHRMIAISQWTTISMALTQRIAMILYGQGTPAVVYTVASTMSTIDLSSEYAVYAWHRTLLLVGRPSLITPANFFRTVVGIEKIVTLFHSIKAHQISGEANPQSGPDGNTLLHIFGSWLFEAASLSSQECNDGRAQAFLVLCRIFAQAQPREPFLETYLHQFYSAIIQGLHGDLLSLVFIIVNCENIFALGLPGVRILIPHFVQAIRRITPEMERALHISLNLEDLRRACYRLLCTVFSTTLHFTSAATTSDHGGLPAISDYDGAISTCEIQTSSADASSPLTASNPKAGRGVAPTAPPQRHKYHEALLAAYGLSPEHVASPASRASPRQTPFWVVDTMISSLLVEADDGNRRYLVNALTTFAVEERHGNPMVAVLLLKIFQDMLASEKVCVNVSLVIVDAIGRFTAMEDQIAIVDRSAIRGLIMTMAAHATSLVNRNALDSYLKLITAIFDVILNWAFGASMSSVALATDGECTSSILQMLTRALAWGRLHMQRQESQAESTSQCTTSFTESRVKKSPSATASLASTPSISRIATSSLIQRTNESQLAAAAEIAIARLVAFFGSGAVNPFAPVHSSTMLNECLMLKERGAQRASSPQPSENELDALSFISGQPSQLSQLCRDDYKNLRYFVLNSTTIACFIERPVAEGSAKQSLVSLYRSIAGRFSWENALIYAAEGGTGDGLFALEKASPAATPFKDEVLYQPGHGGSSSLFSYDNLSADSPRHQERLTDAIPLLASQPVDLAAVGPLYNDSTCRTRFGRDEKRLVNFSCIDGLAREQVAKSKAALVEASSGALLNYNAPLPTRACTDGHLARLLLSHTGLSAIKSRDAALRLPTCAELLADLEVLDGLSERDQMTCSLFYLGSAPSNASTDGDFMSFVQSLGWPVDMTKHPGWKGGRTKASPPRQGLRHSAGGVYFANNDVEVLFSVQLQDPAMATLRRNGSATFNCSEPLGAPSSNSTSPTLNGTPLNGPQMRVAVGSQQQQVGGSEGNAMQAVCSDIVNILWMAAPAGDLTKHIARLSLSSSALVHICVTPLSTDAPSSGLYRINILISTDATSGRAGEEAAALPFIFGPLLDGMIIRRESLGELVRSTAISATTNYMYMRCSQLKPLARRAHFIEHIVQKYAQTTSCAKYYNELIYDVRL